MVQYTTIRVSVPISYIYPTIVKDQGISITSTGEPTLRSAILASQSTTVRKVRKKTVILEFTVANPYLHIFQQRLGNLKGAVLIKGETNE